MPQASTVPPPAPAARPGGMSLMGPPPPPARPRRVAAPPAAASSEDDREAAAADLGSDEPQSGSGRGGGRAGRRSPKRAAARDGGRARGAAGRGKDKFRKRGDPAPEPILRKHALLYNYGNYDPYYEKRYDRYATIDQRVDTMLRLRGTGFFSGKEVLDLGCNAGFVAFLVASLGASRVVAVDIDPHLISQALRRLRSLKAARLSALPTIAEKEAGGPGADDAAKRFPRSLLQSRGVVPYTAKPLLRAVGSPVLGPCRSPQLAPLPTVSLDGTLGQEERPPPFPYNMEFRSENFMLSEIEDCRAEPYDVVLCLKLTKWVHVNWGDEGVKVLFHKCFKVLKPGGVLVLEAQEWLSYLSNKHLSQENRKIRSGIELKPDEFAIYLVHVVGFCEPEALGSCPPLKRQMLLFRRPGVGEPDPRGTGPAPTYGKSTADDCGRVEASSRAPAPPPPPLPVGGGTLGCGLSAAERVAAADPGLAQALAELRGMPPPPSSATDIASEWPSAKRPRAAQDPAATDTDHA